MKVQYSSHFFNACHVTKKHFFFKLGFDKLDPLSLSLGKVIYNVG